MARPTNTFGTYESIGTREDLRAFIANISPVDCVFTRMISKGKAENTYFSWQTDALAAASTSNAQIEGDDVTPAASVATARIGNYCQISNASAVVAATQEVTTKAGRSSELAYQLTKKTKELRRDMEAIITQNQGAVAGNSTTARKTASLESWLATNVSRGAGAGANATVTAGVPTTGAVDGTQRTFTESLLKTVIQLVYTSGGNPTVLMMGPAQKQVFSGFTGGATRMDKAEDKSLTAAVDVYISDFGVLRAVPNRFQRARTAFVIEKDMWALNYLRPVTPYDLAKTGDSMKKLIVVEYGLMSKNEAASGVIADLS